MREKINNVYKQDENKLHLFFSKFNNYFTLNYDTFLYLLLMRFKREGQNSPEAIAFGNKTSFIPKVLNPEKQVIYNAIKEAHKKGKWRTELPIGRQEGDFKKLTKGDFTMEIKRFNKKSSKRWKVQDIKYVCDIIWEERRDEKKLYIDINDGFAGDLFEEIPEHQNLFFLHGSFHIYVYGKTQVRKITQSKDKALYERLENIISAENEEIVCVLASGENEKEIKFMQTHT